MIAAVSFHHPSDLIHMILQRERGHKYAKDESYNYRHINRFVHVHKVDQCQNHRPARHASYEKKKRGMDAMQELRASDSIRTGISETVTVI